jgi:hypothetical protein
MPEIEVTEKMMAVGRDIICVEGLFFSPGKLAKRIYVAMERERTHPTTDHAKLEAPAFRVKAERDRLRAALRELIGASEEPFTMRLIDAKRHARGVLISIEAEP